MDIEWVDGSVISVSMRNHQVTISANKEGLLSLAGQLKTLADDMPGNHIHYDDNNSLEEGSAEMIVEKMR